MKKILLGVITILALFSPAIVRATPTWTMTDTVTATVDSNSSVYDTVIVAPGSIPLSLKWAVIDCTFPADWQTEPAFGICDNKECYNNLGSTAIWNNATHFGPVFTSAAYNPGYGDFHLQLNLKGLSSGTHTVTVILRDSLLNSKTVLFIITKPPTTSVSPVPNPEKNVALYPNPATNELNVVYDASADVKNIAVYNIIGKVMTVYKVTANNSANLDINSLPSGIYFVRLINSFGQVVVTKKFTKQ